MPALVEQTASELQAETTDVLQKLIRFNTVNPPGNERDAMEYVRVHLETVGFRCELLGATPERPNLIARLDGAEPGPTLCLLGHVDTVLADAEEWTHEPWSGDVADGYLWGRGALDMKSQVAAEVVGAAALARSGWRPARGSLLIVCLVDEETGGELGAQWLTENHPDKVRCDMLVNEGGGEVFEYGGKRWYGACCAEKGVFRFTVTTRGVAGHASIPAMGDNALLKMAPILERLAGPQPTFDLTDEPVAQLRALGTDPETDPVAAIETIRAEDPRLATMIEPTLGVTLTPTRISASEKINVIPSQARLKVDCRVPPGLGQEHARSRIEEVLGTEGHELSFDETVEGNRSPMESPLMEEIRSWIGENDPGAEVVPTVLPGFTDSRWFRNAFPECVAYGFFPQKFMSMYECAPLIHGADERIDVRDLGFAASFFHHLPQRLLG